MKQRLMNRTTVLTLTMVLTATAVAVPRVNAAADMSSGNPSGESAKGMEAGEANGLSTTLFVIGPNTGFVSFANAETLNDSTAAVAAELMLSRSTVLQPRDAALDSRGALYLLSRTNGGSIAVYDDPRTATGSRAPDRKVFGEATQISRSPTGIAIDAENDLLYVSNLLTETLVFDISAPESFQGDVAPMRTFEVDVSQFRPEQLRFANGSLYMADARGGTTDIIAFDHPGALRGKVKPDRTITHAGFDNKVGVDVDAKDRLLVAVRKLGQVLMFNNASKLDGVATPDVALSIAAADVPPQPSFATTDSQDRLYVTDSNGNVVFSFDRASELVSGQHYPNRTIGSRELIAPNRLLLVERSTP